MREIKKIDTDKLKGPIPLSIKEYDVSFAWRMYKNFRTMFTIREADILNDPKRYQKLLLLLKDYTQKIEQLFSVKDKFINLKAETFTDFYKITIYVILFDLDLILDSYKDVQLIETFSNLFSSYLPFVKNTTVMLSYTKPFKDNIWKPHWKFIYGTDEINIEFVDCYLDTYFYNPRFQYSNGMYRQLKVIIERIKYIKEKASAYYQNSIVPNMELVTKNIFHSFPYQIIFSDYRELTEIDKNVYKPDLYHQKKYKSDIGWLMCILPIFLTAYLLGYPVISCDIPSSKNMIPKIDKIEKDGIESYMDEVREKNKKRIESYCFDINIANGIDEETGDYTDLIFERVIDYNMDDVIIFYNSGSIHMFTSPEFGELSKKRISPYNRNKIPMINSVNSNLDFKNKINKALSPRKLTVNMNGTILYNIENMLEAVKEKEVVEKPVSEYRYDVYRPPPARTLSLFEMLESFMERG